MNTKKYLVIIFIFLYSGCSSTHYPIAANPSISRISEINNIPTDTIVMKGIGNHAVTGYAGVRAMNFQELTECSTLVVEKTEKEYQLDIDNKRLSVAKQEIQQTSESLEIDRKKVNLSSTKQVNAFNARNHKNIDAIKKMNASVDKYNAITTELRVLTNKFNTICANRPYRQSEVNLLSVKLRQAIESHSNKSDIPIIEN